MRQGPRRVEVLGIQHASLPRGLFRARDHRVLVEVSAEGSDKSCKTRPITLSADGSATLDPRQILFAPQPEAGESLRVQLWRCDRTGTQGELVGQGELSTMSGNVSLVMSRQGRNHGEVLLSVSDALPCETPKSAMSPAAVSTPSSPAAPTLLARASAASPLARAQDSHASVVSTAALAPIPSPRQNVPRFCELHDVSSKRPKQSPRPSSCTSCGVLVQTSYAKFALCPACSEQKRRCMICGAYARVAGSYVPATSANIEAQEALHRAKTYQSEVQASTLGAVRSSNVTASPQGSQCRSMPFFSLPFSPRSVTSRRSLDHASPVPSHPQVVPRRILRKRHCSTDDTGTCDVVIEGLEGLGARFSNTHLVVAVEGEEFRLEHGNRGPGTAGPMGQFAFDFATLQSDLQIYCYDEASQAAIGRILIPLSSIVWPAGESPNLERVCDVFSTEKREFQRRFLAHFAPCATGGDGFNDPGIADSLAFAAAAPAASPASSCSSLGLLRLEVRLALRAEVPSLAKLYGRALLGGVAVARQLAEEDLLAVPPRGLLHYGRPGCAMERRSETRSSYGQAASEAEEDLQALLVALQRVQRALTGGRCGGLVLAAGCLRAQRWRPVVAAAGWFLFCLFGYFPPPLWTCPACAFLLLLAWGSLTQAARKQGYGLSLAHVDQTGASDEEEAATNGDLARELRAIALGVAVALERLANLASFADGPASVVFYAVTSVSALALCVVLRVLTWLEPFSFICGLYGAFLIVAGFLRSPSAEASANGAAASSATPSAALGAPLLCHADAGSRPTSPPAPLQKWTLLRRLGVALAPPWGGCVPEDEELMHRLRAESLLQDVAIVENEPTCTV
eukprot:TRINITY_DN5334_c0_g2_i2.p1 TRINITY_DN5334_c0_g2~~TRINITY_DN5334_c0_g2_i2.p1  ORF type:complete len:853 (+),score=135.70 TRINITY_DN5334_c0_g2_i2:457-3015(+)